MGDGDVEYGDADGGWDGGEVAGEVGFEAAVAFLDGSGFWGSVLYK